MLHPLLTNTQLKETPYKRPQIRRALHALISDAHRREISSTTKRLVERNLKASWCTELDDDASSPISPASGSSRSSHDVLKQKSLITPLMQSHGTLLSLPAGGLGLGTASNIVTSGMAICSPVDRTASPTSLSGVPQHLFEQDPGRRGSTLSVNSVAAASVPAHRTASKTKSTSHLRTDYSSGTARLSASVGPASSIPVSTVQAQDLPRPASAGGTKRVPPAIPQRKKQVPAIQTDALLTRKRSNSAYDSSHRTFIDDNPFASPIDGLRGQLGDLKAR